MLSFEFSPSGRERVGRWVWLCPALAIVLAAAILMGFGFTWWTAILAALLLVCPALLIWGVITQGRPPKRPDRIT